MTRPWSWVGTAVKKSDFEFDLPEHLIAQSPPAMRTDARLMVIDRQRQTIQHQRFIDLPTLLTPDDLLVFNDTRVIPARLFGQKESGGKVEVLFERVLSSRRVLAQIRANRSPSLGAHLLLTESRARCQVVAREDRFFELEFLDKDPAVIAEEYGHMPLPPYIRRPDGAEDRARYQTVYGKRPGAVAAPTAGLHFDLALLRQLEECGVRSCHVTLHVGAGTFQPVQVESIADHQMHKEWFEISEDTARAVNENQDSGGRLVAVGTTSVRTLESACVRGQLAAQSGDTQIFIYPGFQFQLTDALVTNFHLPGSTLLMLVSALAGTDLIREAYQQAVAEEYRFFSYGDAMLIA